MILIVAPSGTVADALSSAATSLGTEVRAADAADPELFMRGLGCTALVYAPVPSLLEGSLEPVADSERMRSVLAAAHGPDIKLFVLVLPRGEAFRELEESLRSDGVPFVVVKSPPLIEEVAGTIHSSEASIWLPSGVHVLVVSASELSRAVAEALETDRQGRTMELDVPELDIAQALEAAASASGKKVKVRRVPRSLGGVARKLRSWFGGREDTTEHVLLKLAQPDTAG